MNADTDQSDARKSVLNVEKLYMFHDEMKTSGSKDYGMFSMRC